MCLLAFHLHLDQSKTLQVQSRHTLQVQDETLGWLRCCFGQDMSSSMRGCTAVWAQEGKEILVHVAEPSHSFPQGVQMEHKDTSFYWSCILQDYVCTGVNPMTTTVSGSDSEWCVDPSCECRSSDCRSAQITFKNSLKMTPLKFGFIWRIFMRMACNSQISGHFFWNWPLGR